MTKQWLLILLALSLVFSLGIVVGCGDDDDDDNDAVDDDAVDDDAADDDAADDDATDDDAADDDDDDDNNDDDDDDDTYVVSPVINEAPPWPQWALEPWAWEDESTQESAVALVEGYLEHDIPISAIIIDSPWETGYNTFEWDTSMYPDPQGMIDEIHGLDTRVMMWITPNMNIDSPLYQEGLDNGYYVSDGRTYEWWKGEGSLIDYWNPDALEWWHGLMDNILDMGIDGWKTDGSEFYVYLWLGVETYDGHKSPTEYQDAYYRDFFEYTREQLGNDRLISARPVDSYAIPFWGPSFAPRDVNFAAWVGDQDPTWFGMNAALTNMFFSGERGFVNFGSDIGGYRGDDIRDEELFVRWAQLGAFCPVMENGGAGEHRPWMYSQQVLDIYRTFAKLHLALVPYLYSQGAEYYDAGLSVYRPLKKYEWHHLLGDNLLVAPIAAEGGAKEVEFPEGTWIDLFTGEQYVGPSTQALNFPLERYPVFVRQGAIIPLDLREDGMFDGSDQTPRPITASIYVDGGDSFNVYEEGGTGAAISYQVAAGAVEISLSATTRTYGFRLHDVDAPTTVTVNPHGELTQVADLAALQAADSGWTYQTEVRQLWVKPGVADAGLIVSVQ